MSFRRIAVAVAGSAAALALTAGCASETTTTPTAAEGTTAAPSSSTVTPGTASPGTVIAGDSGGVTTTQAEQLCSDMADQLQNWRTYTPTIGKGGLNTIVGTWAAQNGINMIDLVTHKARIDVITSAQCPDVREGAMSAIEIPDLASGLIGF